MQLKEILGKVAKGETLTDDERAFCGGNALQDALDAAAGASRKKAEADASAAKSALAKLQAEYDDYKNANDPAAAKDATARLEKRIASLEAANKAAKEENAALVRTQRVRSIAKEAGLNPAKGIDAKAMDLLVDNLFAGVDLDDADAVKSVVDGFKAANAGLIAAETISGVGAKGKPGDVPNYSGANPFAKATFNLTEQFTLKTTNPELANALQQAAANEK